MNTTDHKMDARAARVALKESKIAEDQRKIRVAEEDVNAYVARIDAAKENAAKDAQTIAEVGCKEGMPVAITALNVLCSEKKFTLAESIMFRALVKKCADKIVRESVDPENTKGLTMEEKLICLGYRFFCLNGDDDWYWAYGEGPDYNVNDHTYASKQQAVAAAEQHELVVS